MVVLVEHYDNYLDDLDNNDDKDMEYLHVKNINSMMLNNKDQRWKEVPTANKYGAHVMFVEDAKHRQNRIRMEERVEALAEAAANPGKKRKAVNKQLPPRLASGRTDGRADGLPDGQTGGRTAGRPA